MGVISNVLFLEHILVTAILKYSCEIVLRWMPQDLISAFEIHVIVWKLFLDWIFIKIYSQVSN